MAVLACEKGIEANEASGTLPSLRRCNEAEGTIVNFARAFGWKLLIMRRLRTAAMAGQAGRKD